MDNDYIGNLKKSFSQSPIEYVNMACLEPEVLEERHVRLRLPAKPLHMNHVGTVYAGSMFTIAEIAGANLFMCTYGDAYIPILKSVKVQYMKPAMGDVLVDLTIDEETAREKIVPIAERGKGDYLLDVPLMDEGSQQVALAQFNYYVFSQDRIKEFGMK